MSGRELLRVEVVAQVDDGRLDAGSAAGLPGVARRQIFRLLRRWMIEDGLCLSRNRRRSFHQLRLRHEAVGELVQPLGTLLRSVPRGDAATSRLMQLRFVLSETTFAYFEALGLCLAVHGRPVAVAIVPGPMADDGSSLRGRVDVCWNGMTLNHRVFAKDQQRLIQAAIVESRHLNVVLEHIKTHQEAEVAKPRRPPIQRTRYIPVGRRDDDWNSPAARKARLRIAAPCVAGQGSDP